MKRPSAGEGAQKDTFSAQPLMLKQTTPLQEDQVQGVRWENRPYMYDAGSHAQVDWVPRVGSHAQHFVPPAGSQAQHFRDASWAENQVRPTHRPCEQAALAPAAAL